MGFLNAGFYFQDQHVATVAKLDLATVCSHKILAIAS